MRASGGVGAREPRDLATPLGFSENLRQDNTYLRARDTSDLSLSLSLSTDLAQLHATVLLHDAEDAVVDVVAHGERAPLHGEGLLGALPPLATRLIYNRTDGGMRVKGNRVAQQSTRWMSQTPEHTDTRIYIC